MSSSGLAGRWIGVLGVLAIVLAGIAAMRPNVPFRSSSAVADMASPTPSTGPALAGTPVTVTPGNGCGAGWSGGNAGPFTLAFTNGFGENADVFVEGTPDGKVYAEVEALGPGASRAAQLSLPAGTYRIVCAYTEAGTVAGSEVSVTGSYAGATTPGMQPVTDNDLYGPLKTYMAWVESRIPVVQRQVAALRRDLRAGRTAQAKKDWLAAHMTYNTLGAAYDAFGDLGDAIDGMPSTTARPLRDKHLLGFHKVEALLWAGRKDATIVPYVTKMATALETLHQQFGHEMFMATLDIGLRAHEILEDALRFEVTGRTDAGSHTGLATLSADVVGTQHAVSALKDVLAPRDADYAATTSWLTRLQKLVDGFHHGSAQNTGWTALNTLTQLQRERLDATLSQTLEYLSEVAAITDPVKTMP